MDQTPNLKLPYLMAAQAQKHVTHNEALRMLDAVVQLSVADRDLAAPPGAPADGVRYIVAAAATGGWAGHAAQIAAFQDGAWTFFAPLEGWTAWVADENALVVFDGSGWVAASGGGGSGSVNPVPMVGVNATADTTNRLSVASAATLFNHEGAGHQVKVNKAAAGQTASLLLQSAFSGRAELGLAGDDNFHIKVSSNGTTWQEALVIDRSTGAVSLPLTPASGGSAIGANLVINGDMQVNQRLFAGGALAAGAFGHDRWKAAAGGATYSVAAGVITLSAGALEQVIEPAMWGYASLASTTLTVSIEAPSADVAITLGSQSGTITAGSGRRSVTLTAGAGDTGHLTLRLQKASSGTVSFARVRLEIGSTATGWLQRSLVEELRTCQRYYFKSYPYPTLPGSSVYAGAISCFAGNANQTGPLNFPVEMRTTPTVSGYAPQDGAANKLTDIFAATNTGVASLVAPHAKGIAYAYLAGGGMTAGKEYIIHITASAEL